MSEIDNINRIKSDLDFERTKRKNLAYELQQLKKENEELKKQAKFNLKLANDRGECMKRHWQKLEKIKKICETNIYLFNGGSYISKEDILEIIESDNIPNNNQQSNS